MRSFITILLLLGFNYAHCQWLQKGDTFTGQDSIFDNVGYSLSLDDHGDIIAIGTVNNFVGGNVSVYEFDGSNWNMMGDSIPQTNVTDSFGEKVCLNKTGHILVVSAPSADPNGGQSGRVLVYEWDGLDWIQKGTNINGQNNNEYFGQALDVSADGLTFAAGVNGDTGNPGIGLCRVYQWNGVDDWEQKGLDIAGEDTNDLFGFSVDLDYAGDIVAIGGRGNDGNGDEAGHVRVLEWDGVSWNQLGTDIDGDNIGDWSGFSVSLDSTGHLLAIGSRMNDSTATDAGQVRVFEWDGIDWIQKGSSLYGEGEFAHFGTEVKLNRQGTFLAVGSPEYAADSIGGRATLYTWDNNDWVQAVSHIEMNQVYGWFGHSIDLADSGDDVLIAVGAPNTSSSGEVRVFYLGYKGTLNEKSLLKFRMYPNPAINEVWLEIPAGLNAQHISVTDVSGKVYFQKELNPNQSKFQLNFSAASGVFFVNLHTSEGTITQMLIKQ